MCFDWLQQLSMCLIFFYGLKLSMFCFFHQCGLPIQGEQQTVPRNASLVFGFKWNYIFTLTCRGKTASVSAPKDNTCTYHALMVSSKNPLVGELLMVKLSTCVLHTLPMATEFTLVILCCWLNAHSTHMNGGTIKCVCVCVCVRERERDRQRDSRYTVVLKLVKAGMKKQKTCSAKCQSCFKQKQNILPNTPSHCAHHNQISTLSLITT